MESSSRFLARVNATVDDVAENFLTRIVQLGGYCTVEQARQLGLAGSPTRVLARLRILERAGFLRKVAAYPLVYQATCSSTRLFGNDCGARHRHTAETVATRLLAVNFYLESLRFPGQFIFDHDAKIAALTKQGCPTSELPHGAGEPYLREELMHQNDSDGVSTLEIAHVDHAHRSAFRQLRRLAERYNQVVRYFRGTLELQIAVADNKRHRRYQQLLRHYVLQEITDGQAENVIGIYHIAQPVPTTLSLIWPITQVLDDPQPPSVHHREATPHGGYE